MIPRTDLQRGTLRLRLSAGAICALFCTWASGCTDLPLGVDPGTGEVASPAQLIAASWVGTYDGWGVLTEEGEPADVSDLVMRIAFDAADVAKADCPECLTITFEPWFSGVNFPFTLGASAFVQYTEGDVIRSMSIQKFSAAGLTANSLLVQLRHEEPGPGGTSILLAADLEFLQR